MSARFITLAEAAPVFFGKSVAIVGGGPSALNNAPGYVDSFDVVLRMNNYKTGEKQGYRTDCFYSFFGGSIRKTREELQRDGVKLMMCKVPDAKPIASEWHERNGKQNGIDFGYIFRLRKDFWFGDVYVPTVERFVAQFDMLDRHIPTTGFSAILDVIDCAPSIVYLTGFDLFTSGLHNVNETWRQGDPNDPIGHRSELEAAHIARIARKRVMIFDPTLAEILHRRDAA